MGLSSAPLLSVLKKETPSRTPVWFMRQAGRYLPEYRALRKSHSMLKAIRTPSVASEITLQPLRRFDLDGAIIFADILNPLIGLGISLDFIEKEGPKIFNPIKDPSDVQALKSVKAEESVAYTLEAIELVTKELHPRGVPVLGFAGAPFTLSSYLIEGRTAQSGVHLKKFIALYPESWEALQLKLVAFLVDYLCSQVHAGVSAVQLFDSWVGLLSPHQYRKWVVPYLELLVKQLKERVSAPIIYFSTGTAGLFSIIRTLPFDMVSIDWRSTLTEATSVLGSDLPLQGNLDPEIFSGPSSVLEDEVLKVLADSQAVKHYSFNLGHGILPHTPIENVELVTNAVHAFKR